MLVIHMQLLHMNYQQIIHGIESICVKSFIIFHGIEITERCILYFLLTGMVSKSPRKMSETRISTLQVYASINGRATFIYYNQQWNF